MLSVLGIGALIGLGRLITQLQSGADRAAALNLITTAPPDLEERLVWRPDQKAFDQQRQMEAETRAQITGAYLRAWAEWNRALEAGRPIALAAYFAGPALAGVTNHVTNTVAAGWQLHQSNLHHELELHFYSDDGSIAAFTDLNLQLVQHFRRTTPAESFVVESSHRYDVVMLLQEGNWRVYQWQRMGEAVRTAADSWYDPTLPLPAPRITATVPVANLQAGQLVVDGAPFAVAGINYYPQATPWTLFWPNYSGTQTEADLQRIKALGLNTVRIFIPYTDFGGPLVTPLMRARLADLLARAERVRLKVIVTLFDHHTDHHPATWAADARHLATLIPFFASHPTILAWDIKNEPDRDYGANTQPLVDRWLRFVARHVRWHDPNHLITIGWSNPEAAAALTDVVDLVSFHYFDQAENYQPRVQALQARIGAKPLLLQEFTFSTWNSPFYPGHTEQEQAAYYAAILSQHRQLTTVGYINWTLYDFATVPLAEFRYPWQRRTQAHMGVIRADGSLKAAAALLLPGAPLTVPAPTLAQRLLKPFTLTLMLTGATLLAILLYTTSRRRQRQS